VALEGFSGTLTLSSPSSPAPGSTFGDWRYDGIVGGLRVFANQVTGEVVRTADIGTVSGDLAGFGAIDDDLPCFAEGTRIATPRGEVPVERLRAGDLVVTLRGGRHGSAPLQPLVWVGKVQVDLTRRRDRASAAPVRVRADALAPGVPRRDLRLSPDHALFLDGLLVPVRLLLNGTTILQESWVRRVTYWHLELPAHGLLIAEGAVSESYLDDGNRHLFDAPALTVLASAFAPAREAARREAACAPIAAEGSPALARIRARLAERALRASATG
jgi:hypothetical protein